MRSSIFFLAILIAGTALAQGLGRAQYESQFAMHGKDSEHWNVVKMCLNNWGTHPFKGDIKFRLMETSVKVFGLGNNVVDNVPTDYPQLIYIRPSVSVMSKTTYELKNPNGWYCFKSKVNVMSKTVIKAACKAHITTATGKATVLGKSEAEAEGSSKGTTVMGKSVIQRDCGEGDSPPAEDDNKGQMM